jgi:preprotein translocase subunit SecG
MTVFLIFLHVAVCIALIIIVLLQAGKGAEIGAAFGSGASQTVFGATGSKGFMSKLTTGAAVIFMLTSLILTYFHRQPSTVMPATVPQTSTGTVPAPPAQPTAPAPAPVEPTPAGQK